MVVVTAAWSLNPASEGLEVAAVPLVVEPPSAAAAAVFLLLVVVVALSVAAAAAAAAEAEDECRRLTVEATRATPMSFVLFPAGSCLWRVTQ